MKKFLIVILVMLGCITLTQSRSSAEVREIGTVTAVSGSAIVNNNNSVGISISQTSANLYIGGILKLKINGTNSYVKWKSENKEVLTVSKKGKVTAVGQGVTNVIAIVGYGNDKITLSCQVTVKPRINVSENNIVCSLDGYKDITITCDNLKNNEELSYCVQDDSIITTENNEGNILRIIPEELGVTQISVYIIKNDNIKYSDFITINVFIVDDEEWIPYEYLRENIIDGDYYLNAYTNYEDYTIDYLDYEISFKDDFEFSTLYNVDDLREAGIL